MSSTAPAIRRVPPGFMATEPWWWATGTTIVIDPVAGRIVMRAHRLRLFQAHSDRPLTALLSINATRAGTSPWGLEVTFNDGEVWTVRALHPSANNAEAYTQEHKARIAAGLLS